MKNKLINSAFIFIAISITCLPGFAASPGSLDPSFGVAGKVVTDITGEARLNDIAVMDDGRIVAVGTTIPSRGHKIVRYTADGQLDFTFGTGGIVTNQFSNGEALSVVVQQDRKTVVCGYTNTLSNSGIARYNFNGSLDTTFDSDGQQTINNVSCNSLEIQPDGKIVGVGNSINIDLVVFRLNQNGTFDTTFGTNGFVSTAIGGTGNTFQDVKIQEDGKIVVVGNLNSRQQPIFARYSSNGTLDTTFSGDGLLTIDPTTSPSDAIDNIAIDPIDQTIIGVGISAAGLGTGTFIAVRLTSVGNLDVTFAGDGILQLFFSLDSVGKSDLLIQSDRKIIFCAVSNIDIGGFDQKVVLARLNRDGSLDSSFGRNGISSIKSLVSRISGSIALSGDKLIVGSRVIPSSNRNLQISRHNLSNTPTGSSDFDGDGLTDVAVFRPSTGNWFILRSSDNSVLTAQFGFNGDVPIDGDFDGDGRNDLAIFRPSNGVWFFQRSSDDTVLGATFGVGTDKPIPGDYDKDGKTDIAVFRPSTGEWSILRSSANFSTFFGFPFGQNGDIPISRQGP